MHRPAWATAASAALCCLLLGADPARAAGEQRSDWVWPLAGMPRVVRGFDPPPLRWSAGHRGVDLLAPAGAIVRSAGAGSVTFAGRVAGRGVVVVMHADGTRTTYEPVAVAVRRGEAVRAGGALGRLTAPGGHCLPRACLHWGRRRGDIYLDPMLLLRPAPARLLPVWSGAANGPSTGFLRSDRGPMLTVGAAQRAPTRPSGPSPPWQLISGTATGLPVLPAAVVLAAFTVSAVFAVSALRRRRPQRREGSTAASSA